MFKEKLLVLMKEKARNMSKDFVKYIYREKTRQIQMTCKPKSIPVKTQ